MTISLEFKSGSSKNQRVPWTFVCNIAPLARALAVARPNARMTIGYLQSCIRHEMTYVILITMCHVCGLHFSYKEINRIP